MRTTRYKRDRCTTTAHNHTLRCVDRVPRTGPRFALVKGIQPGHRVLVQLKVVDVRVFLCKIKQMHGGAHKELRYYRSAFASAAYQTLTDPGRRVGLGQRHEAALKRPSDQDLGRCLVVLLGDLSLQESQDREDSSDENAVSDFGVTLAASLLFHLLHAPSLLTRVASDMRWPRTSGQ